MSTRVGAIGVGLVAVLCACEVSCSGQSGDGGSIVPVDAGDAQLPTPDGSTPLPPPPGGFVYPAPGQVTGAGVLPPTVADVEYLGVQSYGAREVARDLGFSGVLNRQSVWTFGDTLVPVGNGDYQITANDSVALGIEHDPLDVIGVYWPGTTNPAQWIPTNDVENANGGLGRYSFGGTNVIEYAPGQGLVYYLKNDRGDHGVGIIGAGVATVTADASGARATRTSDHMWNAFEPQWDVGATYDARDGKVYVFGFGPAGSAYESNVYLARVPAPNAADVSAYEYWDNAAKSWTPRRITLSGANGTLQMSSANALFSNRELGQSNAFWSNYYNTWMFVAGANLGYTDVQVMTAPALEGPWTSPFTVASTCPDTCGAIRYAIAPHPEYDPSGKTLLVTWTDHNVIRASRITWR